MAASDTERIISSGLNTLMMVAFAVPGAAPAGAAIAVGEFFFGLLFPKSPALSAPPPVTKAELNTALNHLQKEVIDAIWKNNTDQIITEMTTLYKEFAERMDGIGQLLMDKDRYVLIAADGTTKSFIAKTDSEYFDLGDSNGIRHKLHAYRMALELHSANDDSLSDLQVAEHQTRTIGLYCFIGSLTVSYLKAAVKWKWGRELLAAWQYEQYSIELENFNTGDSLFTSLTDLINNFPGVDASPTYKKPTWDTFAVDPGSPVPLLISDVQEMLNHCLLVPADDTTSQPAKPGLYPLMRDHLYDMEAKVSAYEVKADPKAGITKAQMLDAVKQGRARAGEWDQLLEKYALLGVTEGQIDKFGYAIELWRAAAASVHYTTYLVVSGDTYFSIATKYDSSWKNNIRAKQIYFSNHLTLKFPDDVKNVTDAVIHDPQQLKAGTLLKIFDPEALSYVPPFYPVVFHPHGK